MRFHRFVVLLSAVAIALAAPETSARPGGGGSFKSGSSGGSSYKSSGSSGGSYKSSGSSGGSYKSSGSSGGGYKSSTGSGGSYGGSGSGGSGSTGSSGGSTTGGGYDSSGGTSVPGPPSGNAPVKIFFFLGIPLVAFLVFLYWRRSQQRWEEEATECMARSAFIEPPDDDGDTVAPPPGERRKLEALRAFDPDFSPVLFDDFLYALYAEVHEARGNGTLARLTPWLAAGARGAIRSDDRYVKQVRDIVIGAIHWMRVSTIPEAVDGTRKRVEVTVRFESNYTEVVARGSGGREAQSYYAIEEWRLERRIDAKSRPPGKTRAFDCPSCGAPLSGLRGRTCSYCKKEVDGGEFDWSVSDIRLLHKEDKAPQLTSDVEEEGTDLDTIVDPESKARFDELAARDPAFSWPNLEERVKRIFSELQVAWSTREWLRARPYVTDNLFQMQLYWIETYKREGLRNVTEDATIASIVPSRLSSDRFFDAITVRVFASSLDYTVRDTDGKVVSGSKSKRRAYSEYWTLVRSVSTRGPARLDGGCPKCGAPLEIEMTGACTHCQAKVASGEFDWVLSRIEQDEVYGG